LSTWSDITSDDEPNDDGENSFGQTGQIGIWKSSLPRPPVPKSFRVPNPPRKMTPDDWAVYHEYRDKTWDNDAEPPWVSNDKSVKGLSDVCPIPNNKTHITWVQFERAKNDGVGGYGYKITHERQLMYWICQFGMGYPFGNPILFTWDEDGHQYVIDEKLSLTICVPGTIAKVVEPFRVMATQIRVLQHYLEKCQMRRRNQTLATFCQSCKIAYPSVSLKIEKNENLFQISTKIKI